MRRFRLVSDSTTWNTRLYDPATGEEIPGCCEARIEIGQANGFIPQIWLRFLNVDLDVIAEEATTEEEE